MRLHGALDPHHGGSDENFAAFDDVEKVPELHVPLLSKRRAWDGLLTSPSTVGGSMLLQKSYDFCGDFFADAGDFGESFLAGFAEAGE